jgi:hypothetical protein
MKTTIKLTALLLALTALYLTGCSPEPDGNDGNGTGTAPAITTASLPGGTAGTAYSQTLTATGDTPVTWSIDTGALPNGLTLSNSTISGTPTTAGTSEFTVKATNAAGNDTKALSITVIVPFVPEYSLGDTGPGGGKIFYISQDGFTVQMADSAQNYTAHYLEAAPADMSSTLEWASSGSPYTSTYIYTGQAIGTGRENTARIRATDYGAPAAKACNEYSNNGKTDWFLPSLSELEELYKNRASVGNMEVSVYWSSSEGSNDSAWYQSFSDGYRNYNAYKSNPYLVRAVRAF